MSKNSGPKGYGIKFLRFLSSIIIMSASVCAGLFLASVFSRIDVNSFMENVGIELNKSVLDESLPIINAIYNNGNISTSISRQINDIANKILPFNIDNPITILNAQTAVLRDYGAHVPHKKADSSTNKIEADDTGDQVEGKISYTTDPGDKKSGGEEEPSSSISTDDVEKEVPSKRADDSNGKITIQNETKLKVDIDELLNEPLKFKFDKKKDRVLIYHTHTTESYLTSISQLNSAVSTRTSDTRHSVVRVGEALAQSFRNLYGMQVIHNATIHDYPDYNNSYSNALNTVTEVLKAYPNIEIVIDLHRDAAGDSRKLREVASVNGKNAAKIMFVVATGEEKKNHPNWKENLKLALKIQEKLNEECPGITMPINMSKYRYNQHVSQGALLIEIGGDGNVLDECLESTKYLSKAINDVLK